MKKINGSLLKARMDDKQLLINQACFLENLETNLGGAGALLDKAKKFLAVDSEDSVIALHESVVKEYNKLSNVAVKFNGALLSLKELNLVESEELAVLEKINNNLVEKICNLYDIDVEDLLEE